MPDWTALVTRDAGAPPIGWRGYSAEKETGISRKHFGADCPYDWDAIMTRSFVLDQTGEAP